MQIAIFNCDLQIGTGDPANLSNETANWRATVRHRTESFRFAHVVLLSLHILKVVVWGVAYRMLDGAGLVKSFDEGRASRKENRKPRLRVPG